MSPALQAQVRERAGNRCEYCQLRQEDSPLAALHIEPIVPRIHGGADDHDNLALACIDCNLHKGPNLTGIDPETRRVTELSFLLSAISSLRRVSRRFFARSRSLWPQSNGRTGAGQSQVVAVERPQADTVKLV